MGIELSHGKAAAGAPLRVAALAIVVVATVAGSACSGGTRRAPRAGDSTGAAPSLVGTRVLVFPFQGVAGIPGQPDAELAFALQSRGQGVAWILPDQSREALRSSPGLQVNLTGLPVGVFMRAEVQRVGDPIYGTVRRLAALMDGHVALIPVQVRYRPEAEGVPGAAEVAAALLDVRSGQVLWFGIVEGAPGAADDPGVLASALDALARTLAPGLAGGGDSTIQVMTTVHAEVPAGP
ncbi:MAG TPA: hypothetical protein VGA70_03650 [Longimicrobiales bacterium]